MLRRLSLQTAGESHGRGMLATLAGLPAGLPFEAAFVDAFLARRQSGFGRSARQRLESDRVEVLAGVHRGRTTGAPLALVVWNRDDSLASRPPLHAPRPGHGDLAGGQKYGARDMRPVLERASARETAARVAAGAFAASALAGLGVRVFAHVLAVGTVEARPDPALGGRLVSGAPAPAGLAGLARRREASAFACLDPRAEARMRRSVLAARRAGDTLGGRFEVRAFGLPPGLGGLDTPFSRLDARLGAALLSIPAIKAVEVGDGVAAAALRGSAVHDELLPPRRGGPARAGNRAGGVEAGMSNGLPLVARAWMKPLPTLARSLRSWDFEAGRPASAFYERSDVTAVPAASVVGEAMVALVLLDALLEMTGGDHRAAVLRALSSHRREVARLFGRAATERERGSRGKRTARR